MMNFIKKYKMIFIISIIMLLLSFAVIIFYKNFSSETKDYTTDNYYVKYDNSWSIKSRDDNHIVLSHGKGNLSFNIYELDSEKVYLDIDSLIDDIRYEIEKNNENYQLLSKKSTHITKNNFSGYWLLYENETKNVKIGVYKEGSRVVIIKFEANVKYFDMLLDSVNNIIYNFTLLDKDYSLGDELSIKTSEFELVEKNPQYQGLDKTYTEEIANNNYLVNFNIPINYQSINYNSNLGVYHYIAFGDYLANSYININIYLSNVYEYLQREIYGDYGKYNGYKKNKDFKENLMLYGLYENDKQVYLYRNSYTVESPLGDSKYENVLLIQPLDRNHTMTVEFSNRNSEISRELIDSFKINYIKNYSSYVKGEVVDNNYVCYLRKRGSVLSKGYDIKVSIPKEFKEVDYKTNIYEIRNFGKDYNYDDDIFAYDVRYSLDFNETFAIEQENSTINARKKYGKYQEMKYEGAIKINNYDVKLYSGYYVESTNGLYSKHIVSNVKILTYKLPDDKVLSVKIRGNDKKIDNDFVKQIISFEIIEENS